MTYGQNYGKDWFSILFWHLLCLSFNAVSINNFIFFYMESIDYPSVYSLYPYSPQQYE